MAPVLTKEQLCETFKKYYVITGNEMERIPTCIVFARIAKDLNVEKLNPTNIRELTEELKLNRKSVMYSNGSNGLVDMIRRGRFSTISATMRDEIIDKYGSEPRVNLRAIIGIREKEPLREPENFDNQKLNLIAMIVHSQTVEELRNKCLKYIDAIYPHHSEEDNAEVVEEELLSDYKQKNITINKTQTTIQFQ